jgi:hypothetical protein
MSVSKDVSRLVSIHTRVKALEAERREIYSFYELVGAGAVDVLNREFEAAIEKQTVKKMLA